MAKPILTIGVPLLSKELYEEIESAWKNTITDYHVIIYRANYHNIKFEVFNEKDMTDIELHELKELVNNSISNSVNLACFKG